MRSEERRIFDSFGSYHDRIGLTATESGATLDLSNINANFMVKIEAELVHWVTEWLDINGSTGGMLVSSGWNSAARIVDYFGTHLMTLPLQAAMAGNGLQPKGTAGWNNSRGAAHDLRMELRRCVSDEWRRMT